MMFHLKLIQRQTLPTRTFVLIGLFSMNSKLNRWKFHSEIFKKMKGVKLAFQGGQKFNDQFAAISGQQNANNQIPQQINADALLLGDYGRFEIDCSSNSVVLTLKDATQIGNFTWFIYRSDESAFRLTVVPEIVGQLINGFSEWEIFGKETFVIHAEQDKFTLN